MSVCSARLSQAQRHSSLPGTDSTSAPCATQCRPLTDNRNTVRCFHSVCGKQSLRAHGTQWFGRISVISLNEHCFISHFLVLWNNVTLSMVFTVLRNYNIIWLINAQSSDNHFGSHLAGADLQGGNWRGCPQLALHTEPVSPQMFSS